MPVDLKKFKRIFSIHRKLRGMNRFSWEEIVATIAIDLDIFISQRTLEYDISALKNEFGAPVQKRGGLYHYTKPFSIFEVFDNDEYGRLDEILALLRNQKAKDWPILDELLLNLEQKISFMSGEKSSIIQFETAELTGLDYLEKLYKMIKDSRTLNITYAPFNLESKEIVAKPVILKEYNNRWFVFCWEKNKTTIQNYALDRIKKIAFSSEEIRNSGEFDQESYFNDIIGVTKLPKVEIETIKFSLLNSRANYVITKKIHSSQKRLVELDIQSKVFFEICVIPNKEMWAKFLEFGSDLQIIEPVGIKNEHILKLKEALNNYNKH